MIMKKRKNWLTALLSMFVLASCSLEEDTSSFSTPDNFYQTKEQCLSALNSCYIPLNGTYNYTLFIATESCISIRVHWIPVWIFPPQSPATVKPFGTMATKA